MSWCAISDSASTNHFLITQFWGINWLISCKLDFEKLDSIELICIVSELEIQGKTDGIWKIHSREEFRLTDFGQTCIETTNFEVIFHFWMINCKCVFENSESIVLNHILKWWETHLKTIGIWKSDFWWGIWDCDPTQPSLDQLFLGYEFQFDCQKDRFNCVESYLKMMRNTFKNLLNTKMWFMLGILGFWPPPTMLRTPLFGSSNNKCWSQSKNEFQKPLIQIWFIFITQTHLKTPVTRKTGWWMHFRVPTSTNLPLIIQF